MKTKSRSNISILLIALVFLTPASIVIGNTNNVSVYGEQYGYNDNYPTKLNKYECQKGPMEGFFVSSPEFCKSEVSPNKDRDGDGPNNDRDGDGVNNDMDNCPDTTNSDQADRDGDRIGNVCDPDRDGDGVNNDMDNCPDTANSDQADRDGDRIGNVCDPTPDPITPGVDPLTFVRLGYEPPSDFSTGWEWGTTQAASPDRLVTVAKTSRSSITPGDPDGSQVLRAIVDPNDIVSDGARAEVLHNNPLPGRQVPFYLDGDEMWFHWYTLFPADLTVPNKFHIWTQFHQDKNTSTCFRPIPSQISTYETYECGAVPILFNLRDHGAGPVLELNVINQSNSDWFDTLWTTSLTNDKSGNWYEFLLHVKWDKCGDGTLSSYNPNGTCKIISDGFVELWVKEPNDPDNKANKVVDKTNPDAQRYTMDDDRKVYAKQGLYHCLESKPDCPATPIQTIYHDGMEVAICPPSNPNYHPNTGKCFTTEPYT